MDGAARPRFVEGPSPRDAAFLVAHLAENHFQPDRLWNGQPDQGNLIAFARPIRPLNHAMERVSPGVSLSSLVFLSLLFSFSVCSFLLFSSERFSVFVRQSAQSRVVRLIFNNAPSTDRIPFSKLRRTCLASSTTWRFQKEPEN